MFRRLFQLVATQPDLGFAYRMRHRIPGTTCTLLFIAAGISALVANTESLNEDNLSSSASSRYKYADAAGIGVTALNFFSEDDMRKLEKDGYLVKQNILNENEIKRALEDVGELKVLLELPPCPKEAEKASYRSDSVIMLGTSYRDDIIARRVDPFVREEGAGEALLHASLLLRSVGGLLQEAGFQGFENINEFSDAKVSNLRVPPTLQLSHYKPSETFYSAHRDAPIYDPSKRSLPEYDEENTYRKRFVTAILYLNDTAVDSWNTKRDGGMLRVYPDTTAETADIIPNGGTLVVFDSHELLHEVMPTRRDRYALTCWFTT